MKQIGPTFPAELAEAGLVGLPFSWGNDGVLSLDVLTEAQRDAVLAVYAAHDPDAGPTLSEAKEAGIEEVRLASERVRFRYCPAGKEIDIRRLAPGYTQEHLDDLNAFLDNMLNPVANQASTEINDAADLETLEAILAGYRELYGAELS